MVSKSSNSTINHELKNSENLGLKTIDFISKHPEEGHAEYECSDFLVGRLEEVGFDVKKAICGMETAFIAEIKGKSAGPTIGIVVQYDAVPFTQPDGSYRYKHACGHPQIAASIMMVAAVLAKLQDSLQGTIKIIGCPADEIHSPLTRIKGDGKGITAAGGLWDDIDYALYSHPEFMNTVFTDSRWMQRVKFTQPGKRTLSSQVSSSPINVFHYVADFVKQNSPENVMLERLLVDGDVEEATGLVTTGELLFFESSKEELQNLIEKFTSGLDNVDLWFSSITESVKADKPLAEAVFKVFEELDMEYVRDPDPLPFATDFGNISRRTRSALIGVGREGGWAFHRPIAVEQFASGDGDEVTKNMANVIVRTIKSLTS